ncbi:MAG: Glycerol-3-phosphate acyltransferase [Bacteroidetes bacterium]|nr:Glycerol-3-phosphate acyltransferase [Bacteroidota bacterium]HET6274121.1 glycerol-3-phosphate 1-O-acyltransferase PlsY [Bacteroidota bacterium]
MLPITIIAILSYLVGSIPTSIIVAKMRRGIDIRQHGSGNAGGTNVIRVLGWKAGVFVIAMDMAKGLLATMVIARLMYGPIPFENKTPFDDFTVVQIIAGCAAILGHIWTLFAGFKGGKGIATAGGMLIGVAPVEVAVSLGVFAIVFLISHYVSLGSLSAAVAFPLTMFFRENIFMVEVPGYNTLIFFSIGISLLIIYTHRSNIKRLLKGTENRIARIPLFNK